MTTITQNTTDHLQLISQIFDSADGKFNFAFIFFRLFWVPHLDQKWPDGLQSTKASHQKNGQKIRHLRCQRPRARNREHSISYLAHGQSKGIWGGVQDHIPIMWSQLRSSIFQSYVWCCLSLNSWIERYARQRQLKRNPEIPRPRLASRHGDFDPLPSKNHGSKIHNQDGPPKRGQHRVRNLWLRLQQHEEVVDGALGRPQEHKWKVL